MVTPGDPSYCLASDPAPYRARFRHCMVSLAPLPSGHGTEIPLQTEPATVMLILQLSLLIDQEFGGVSLPVAGLGDGLMDPTPERPGENEVEAEASTQLEAGDE